MSSLSNRTIMQVCATLGHGGSEKVALEAASAVRAASGTALIAGAPGGLMGEIKLRGIEVAVIPSCGYWPHDIIGNVFRLRRMIRERHIDLLHIHNRAPGWSALWAARAEGIPIISTYHSGYKAQNSLKRWFNSVMVRTDRVILTSDYIKGAVTQIYGPDPGNRVSLYNGIDVDRFSKASVDEPRRQAVRAAWNLPDDVPVFLMATRLTRLKGHLVAIEAIARLRAMTQQPFLCVFAGGDERGTGYITEIHTLIASLGVGDYVRIPGVCQDMPAALAVSTAVLSPSVLSENLPLTRLEAGAMELPVICTPIGAATEHVLAPPAVTKDQRTGWLVPTNDALALAAAMKAVLDMPIAERKLLGQRTRTYMEQHFNLKQSISRLVDLYAHMLLC